MSTVQNERVQREEVLKSIYLAEDILRKLEEFEIDSYDDDNAYMKNLQILKSNILGFKFNQSSELEKFMFDDENSTILWLYDQGVSKLAIATFIHYLDIEKCEVAGQFFSLCGLNDHKCPWFKTKGQVENMVKKIFPDKRITNDRIRRLNELTGRSPKTLKNMAGSNKDTERLISELKKPPYNKYLKKAVFDTVTLLIQNEKSQYSELYSELNGTDVSEEMKNKNFKMVQKVFVNHLFEQMRFDKYGDVEYIPYKFLINGELKEIPCKAGFYRNGRMFK